MGAIVTIALSIQPARAPFEKRVRLDLQPEGELCGPFLARSAATLASTMTSFTLFSASGWSSRSARR
jgi:hypothetical protein